MAGVIFSSCGGGGGGGAPDSLPVTPPPGMSVPAELLQRQRTPEFLRSHGLEAVKAEYSLARGGTGRGVTVGVLDHGALYHEAIPAPLPAYLNRGGLCDPDIFRRRGVPIACFPNPPAVLPSDRIYSDLFWVTYDPAVVNLVLHHDLVSRRPAEPKLLPNDPADSVYRVPGSTDTDGFDQHGTQVTSIIAGERDNLGIQGIAPEVQVRFRRFDTNAVWLSLAQLVGTVPIMNNSWTFSVYRRYARITEAQVRRDIPAELIEGMEQRNIPEERRTILVFAAGNDGEDDPNAPAVLPYFFPAMRPHTLVVGSVDYSDPDRGPAPARENNLCGVTREFCLVAPGVGGSVWIDGRRRDWQLAETGSPAYTSDTGTSFAAPLVTGALAVLKQLFPTLGNTELVRRLLVSADKSPPFHNENIYGQGLLDMQAATSPIGQTRFLFGSSLTDARAFFTFDSVLRPGGAVGDAIERGFAGRTITSYDRLNTPFRLPLASFTADRRGRLARDDERRFNRHALWSRPSRTGWGRLHRIQGYRSVSGLLWRQRDGGGLWLSMGVRPDHVPGMQTDSAFDEADGYANPYVADIGDVMSTGYTLPDSPTGRYGLVLFSRLPSPDKNTGVRGFFAFGRWRGERQTAVWQGGFSRESEGWLASAGTGAFAGLDAMTSFVGLDWQVRLGRQWYGRLAAYNGHTRPAVVSRAVWAGAGRMRSSAFSIGLERKNWLTHGDRWGLRLHRPLRVEKGELRFRLPTGRTQTGILSHDVLAVPATPSGREMDISLTYEVPGDRHSRWKARLGAARQPGHTRTADREARVLLLYQRSF